MSVVEILMFHNVFGILALFITSMFVVKEVKRWKMWFVIYAIIQLLLELNDFMWTASIM